ncbi:MAG TPA: mechanosensitive ion channel domain-containing protein [Candidatus Binatia bacterium]|jgi:small conductance mechanosensitive channel
MKPNINLKGGSSRNLGALRVGAISTSIAVVAALLLASSVSAEAAENSPQPAPRQTAASGNAATPTKTTGEISEAEILIRLQQIIAQDQRRLRALESRSEQLAREFEAASKRFNNLDAELKAARKAQKAPAEITALEGRWALARDELDPLFQRRQAIDQQIKILQRKIEKQKEALDWISSGQVPSSLATPATLPPTAKPAEGAAPESSPKTSFPVPPALKAIAPKENETSPKKPAAPEMYDRRVADAERELQKREQKLRLAERGARLVEQLTSLNQDDLAQARALAEASRNQQELLDKQVAKLESELKQLSKQAPARGRAALEERIAETHRLATEAAATAADDAKEVAALELRVKNLDAFRVSQAARVSEAESDVESARRRVEFLQSPLAPHRIWRWLLDKAPRVAAILVVLALIWFGARWLTQRVVQRMATLGRRGSDEGRVERVETLRRVLQSVITIGFIIMGTLAVLPEFGADVTVLVGGAAVFSLAIAFGAQNLVKDYFSGFMILMEDQYRVGNVVQINNRSGVVEDISLRMTTLRDLEGIAHFVPHGQITTVSNLTRGWSRVVLDIGVAYKEDVDRVMEVLMELAREMRKEPQFSLLILEDPEMLGVDAFADSAVVIKFIVRTRPLKQWIVRRELLRRIKNRFDELGIEIPFPHRTLYHRGLEEPLSVQLSNGVGETGHQGEDGGRR